MPQELKPGRYAGKSVLVTGAASGIGRASARRFAAEGAGVLVVDRDGEEARRTVALIVQEGGRAEAHEADAGQEAAVRGMVEQALGVFGRLDALFANAGISGGGTPILDQTEEQWMEVLRVNLIGVAMAIKHGGPVMARQGGGAIVATASVAGIRAGAGGPAYSASKAGVINLVQVAAQQFAGTGVRINAICPGLIETNMTKPLLDRAREMGAGDRIGQLNPLRRSAQPEEIAAVAAFLCSDDASYVNGHALVADGGLASSHPFIPRPPGQTTF